MPPIPFAHRSPPRKTALPPVLAVSLLLPCIAGCTVPPPPVAPAAQTMPQRGVIVAVRTITTPSPSRAAAAPADPRGAVLRALAVRADAPPPSESAEYLVRRDDGRTVSVVQKVTAGLHPGETVLLRGTGPMALAPAP